MNEGNTENQPVQIVEASEEDAAEIFDIQKSTWLATYPNEESQITTSMIEDKFANRDSRIEKWRNNIQSGAIKMWVAKNGERTVGFCGVRNEEEVNRLATIYVYPNAQGSGVGGKLIQQALGHLGRDKDIILDVASYNDAAISFYQKFGFEVLGDVPEDELLNIGDVKLPEVRMILRKFD